MNDKHQIEIMIVDDTPANLKLLNAMLTQAGYKVRPALTGELALNAARKAPPDLILLDIRMPVLDGFAVCRALKADAQLCHIPVIFISAQDENQDISIIHDIGGLDLIGKPFQLADVLHKIERYLDSASAG